MKKKLLVMFFLLASVCLISLTSCKKELEHVEMVEATCQAQGNKEYWKDKKGRIYLDENGKEESNLEGVTLSKVALEHVEYLDSTDKETGHKEHYKCPKCGKLYEDKEATKELKEEDVFIPMKLTLVPAIEATCQAEGLKAHYVDGNGNLYLDDKGLVKATKADVVISKVALITHEKVPATPYEEGNIEYYECPKCGKLYSSLDALEENEIKLEDTVIPKQKVQIDIYKYPDRVNKGALYIIINGTMRGRE